MTAAQPIPRHAESSSEALMNTLVARILAHADEEGFIASAIPGLELVRADSTTACMGSRVYEPALCLIAQGAKTVWLGDRQIDYGPLSCMVSAVPLPILGKVTDASPQTPYLGIKLTIDPQEVTDLILAMGLPVARQPEEELCPEGACGLGHVLADRGMLEALSRLVGLLDTPQDIAILAPLVRREILYRALVGELAPYMRKFAMVDGQTHRMGRVIEVLQARFREPLRVGDLADLVSMSESSLFHSFKQVTRMSPLQFQKRLRLHEARRLMLAEGMEAATASYRVGYSSPSHFSREYSRMFGVPPRADVIKLRGDLPAATPAPAGR